MDLSPELRNLVDDLRLHVFEMRNLTLETRELFTSDMRHVADYLAKGNGFRSDRPVYKAVQTGRAGKRYEKGD